MDIPEELMENRETIECNFVLSLYRDLTFLSDYANVVNGEDIITPDGQFYYGLLQGLSNSGFEVADNMSIYTYLENKDTLKKGFERRGGYSQVKEITELLSLRNLDAYYDELVKSNLLIRLNNAGFNVLDNLEKFSKMTSEQVYDYYDYQLANISVGKIEKVQVEDLSIGWEDWIQEMDSGVCTGFSVGSRLLDYQLAGIHKGELTLYLGGIGKGKTSSSVPLFILPTIENGNDVTILCNEQNSKQYRSMIIATVLFSKVGSVRGMNRMTINKGKYTDDNKANLKKAVEWIEKQPGKIKFVEMQNYNAVNVRKVIKKQAKVGCSFFFFDVLKSESDASDKSWALLSDVAKELFLLAKKEDVAILATAQLASDSMNRKYLDLGAVGKSRAISECAATVIMFRPVMNNEKDKINPYKWDKSDDSKRIKRFIELEEDKHYIIVFIPKNRFGDTSIQIILEFDQSFNTIRDVGYCNISYDNFQR